MDQAELEKWLNSDEPELVSALETDIKRHISELQSAGGQFYSYAVLPSNYCTSFAPPNIVVAFNREADIPTGNEESSYYRFSVDEWANYVHDGFETTNSVMDQLYQNFYSSYKRDPNSYIITDTELSFIKKLNQSILVALNLLKDRAIFPKGTFLVIWLPESSDNIMLESAKILNSSEVFELFNQEFS